MAPRAHGPGERVQVSSAGSEPSDRVHPLAVRAMTEIGLDISTHTGKSLTDFAELGQGEKDERNT